MATHTDGAADERHTATAKCAAATSATTQAARRTPDCHDGQPHEKASLAEAPVSLSDG